MSEITAICGLPCHECGAYIATMTDDDAKREEVARMWSEMYKADIKPSDINCSGCTTDGGPVFHHCTVCEIRKCGKSRGVVNCAHCDDYGCEKTTEFFEMVPDCKVRLDAIRAGLED